MAADAKGGAATGVSKSKKAAKVRNGSNDKAADLGSVTLMGGKGSGGSGSGSSSSGSSLQRLQDQAANLMTKFEMDPTFGKISGACSSSNSSIATPLVPLTPLSVPSLSFEQQMMLMDRRERLAEKELQLEYVRSKHNVTHNEI